MTVLANDPNRTTNAQAIADLHELGWLRDDDAILDLTVGPKAGFWKLWRPTLLHTNDVDPSVEAHTHYDVRAPGFMPKSYDVITWDPDYAYRGTSALASDANYGLAGPYRTPDTVDELLIHGTRQALAGARRLVLVKCQDSNVASTFRDQSGFVTEAARKVKATVVGKLYVRATRAQPKGKKQVNIWGYNSVLLVIRPAP